MLCTCGIIENNTVNKFIKLLIFLFDSDTKLFRKYCGMVVVFLINAGDRYNKHKQKLKF